MEEGDEVRRRKSLFFGEVEDQLMADAEGEFAELDASLSEMDDESTESAILQMSPAPRMSASFLDENGLQMQVAVVNDLEAFIMVTPAREGVRDRRGEDDDILFTGTPRTPVSKLPVFTPRANRRLFSPLARPSVDVTPGEITRGQGIVTETPAGRLRLSFIPEHRSSILYEGKEGEDEDEDVVIDAERRLGRRFTFVIWEDSPGSGASSVNGAPTREKMSITACTRQSLVCGQVYSARGIVASSGIRSFVAKTTVEGNEVHAIFESISMENRNKMEMSADETNGILVDAKVVGRVLITKSEFVESRTYGVSAIRVSNTLLTANDRRFAYLLPVAGERESGFFYLNVEYYNRGLGGLVQFPVFSIGFNVRFLAFFVTEIGFAQRFNVEISPGLVITVVMNGQVTKGLSYRLTGMRAFEPKKELMVKDSITLSLTSIKIHYPLDWFEVFPNVARNIPGYRARRNILPVPQFGINCDMCKVSMDLPLRCKGCMKTHYCSKECQVEAWNWGHKLVCGKRR